MSGVEKMEVKKRRRSMVCCGRWAGELTLQNNGMAVGVERIVVLLAESVEFATFTDIASQHLLSTSTQL